MPSLFRRFHPNCRSTSTGPCAEGAYAARVRADLTEELPDEDLGEDLGDLLELYRMGSKPRCEEAEYLELIEDALHDISRGR
ncbi:MAG TPA: hypothetical protein VFY14_20610 [Streptomyces sp.]|nr:hypothetical protein [Streptomyces sp.]